MEIDDYKFVEDVAFVIWKWKWLDECDDDRSETESRTSIEVIPETPSPIGSDDECDEAALVGAVAIDVTPQVTHTITFKCIGSTKEDKYKKNLKLIFRITQQRSGSFMPDKARAKQSI